jgi:hypothetical protein
MNFWLFCFVLEKKPEKIKVTKAEAGSALGDASVNDSNAAPQPSAMDCIFGKGSSA